MKKRDQHPKAWSIALALIFGVGLLCAPSPASAAQENVTAIVKIPVRTANLAQGLMLTGPSVQGIEIEITGPVEQMHALQQTPLTYELDLTGLTVGAHIIPVMPEQIALPDRIHVAKVHTPTITLRIDREIKKELPIVIAVEGDPAPGYLLTGASGSPPKALVRGPSTILENIGHITTNPIDLAGASESFKKEITLHVVEGVTVVSPKYPVLARIDIAEKTITRAFKELPLAGHDISLPYSITPPAISLAVKGPANVVNTLETSREFVVYMDLKGLEPGVYVRRATIVLPVNTLLVGVSPEIFTVTIKGND